MDHPSDQLTKTPWWHSRRKRRGVLYWVWTPILLFVYFYFDVTSSSSVVILLWYPYLIEWLFFRFFDPQYPTDDIDRPPILPHYAATFEQPKPHELLIVLLIVVGYFGMIVVLF